MYFLEHFVWKHPKYSEEFFVLENLGLGPSDPGIGTGSSWHQVGHPALLLSNDRHLFWTVCECVDAGRDLVPLQLVGAVHRVPCQLVPTAGVPH